MTSNNRYENVSSESELLILVDEDDNEIGTISKADAHDAKGMLHRAFSLFIFNDKGELLLQQRSPEKRLWGGYWSNSCCSHPRVGETMDIAVHRRLEQELGMTANLEFVYKFSYQADFGDLGGEHELCSVYVGRATSEVRANTSEISDWRWISPAALDAEMADNPERFTPWFKLEWNRMRDKYRNPWALTLLRAVALPLALLAIPLTAFGMIVAIGLAGGGFRGVTPADFLLLTPFLSYVSLIYFVIRLPRSAASIRIGSMLQLPLVAVLGLMVARLFSSQPASGDVILLFLPVLFPAIWIVLCWLSARRLIK